MEIGHWITELDDFDPEQWYGFIYRVTNNINKMEYIGRKNFKLKKRVKVKGRINRKITYVPSKWESYTTSSTHVKNAIEEHGMDNFTFEIIELCLTKGELSYREIAIQWGELVLETTFSDGTPKYYNKNIGAVKFRLDSHSQFSRNKIGDAHRSNLSDFIKKANIKHNGLYDYSESEYMGSHNNVKIICTIHGEFVQSPSNHLSGAGCNSCGDVKSAKSKHKKIDQYDKDGTYIRTWDSGKDISNTLGIHHGDLSQCCTKKIKTSQEYIWCYEGEEPSEWQLSDKLTTARKIDQYDKDGTYIRTWDSATEASDNSSIQRSNISHCCIGNLKTAGGYIWKYAKVP